RYLSRICLLAAVVSSEQDAVVGNVHGFVGTILLAVSADGELPAGVDLALDCKAAIGRQEASCPVPTLLTDVEVVVDREVDLATRAVQAPSSLAGGRGLSLEGQPRARVRTAGLDAGSADLAAGLDAGRAGLAAGLEHARADLTAGLDA